MNWHQQNVSPMPGLVMAMNVWHHHTPSAVSVPTIDNGSQGPGQLSELPQVSQAECIEINRLNRGLSTYRKGGSWLWDPASVPQYPHL